MESTELVRLRRVAGKQTTRLTHYGRKTGNPHEVTIWFVLDGDRLYIGTANVNRHWVRNVQKSRRSSCQLARRTSRAQPGSLATAASTNAPCLPFAGNIGCFDRSLSVDVS